MRTVDNGRARRRDPIFQARRDRKIVSVYRSPPGEHQVSYASHELLIFGYQPSRARSFSGDPQVYVSCITGSYYDAAHHIYVLLSVGHGEKLHDVPDEYLEDSLIVAKKIAVASGFEDYNILQVRDLPRSLYHVVPMYLDWPEQRKDRSPGENRSVI